MIHCVSWKAQTSHNSTAGLHCVHRGPTGKQMALTYQLTQIIVRLYLWNEAGSLSLEMNTFGIWFLVASVLFVTWGNYVFVNDIWRNLLSISLRQGHKDENTKGAEGKWCHKEVEADIVDNSSHLHPHLLGHLILHAAQLLATMLIHQITDAWQDAGHVIILVVICVLAYLQIQNSKFQVCLMLLRWANTSSKLHRISLNNILPTFHK